MNFATDENLINLARACPFPLYAVGGCVRDALAGLKSDKADVDICAPADADTFIAVAVKRGAVVNSVYKNTGAVKFTLGGKEYEFTCFRSDEYVRGAHRPVKTYFTEDISSDARRRDFKCNAVYFDIGSGEIVDPLGGAEDIVKKRVTTVRDADKVFGEDGLRLMRLARQAGQTGFEPSEDCIDGARKNASLITDVSAERVYAELDAILSADLRYGVKGGQYRALEILNRTGVLDFILPELTAGRGMAQPKEYHSYDVLEHSLRAVLYAHPSVRLAALLHDIGKPYAMLTGGTFHGHEAESARIAREALIRLKAPKRLTEETVRLCAGHMYDLKCDVRESKVRKFLVENADIIDKLLYVKQADYSACRDDTSEAPCVTKWKEIIAEMKLENVPFGPKNLAVRGDELIIAGVPKEKISKILRLLLCDCAVEPKLNDKVKLLPRALRYADEV